MLLQPLQLHYQLSHQHNVAWRPEDNIHISLCYRVDILKYRTGALLGACAYTSTGKKYALIREMRLIKSAFFNAGILRTAAKYAMRL